MKHVQMMTYDQGMIGILMMLNDEWLEQTKGEMRVVLTCCSKTLVFISP